ncbi:DNA (cytosine-5)-methyltransferase 1 [Hymenobacter daecheongensis DSM 21074]|uniref:DNA (cytosine-5-)-methyltransferase n=1 Tax=Hymenobacter daecheongensis DSM 21074 TaxID=1121955 RepID=A0A1M6J281_9BACT|nr:DNA cytosine methyltransferase [Hymenobacter daecheongensis]SHJ40701.1 DNA (cytosine-5)-methyltransferase 1 [Hymenobacter daecheongensis DSM 21074]
MIGVDLFSGAGGMSVGARQAGIRVHAAVENDPHAAHTYRANHPDVLLFADDIRHLVHLDVPRNEPLVIFGGPPCQGFSTSNQRTRSAENTNNWLYAEFLRVVQMFTPLPEWIVFENVKGFTETADGLFLQTVLDQLRGLGYTVTSQVLNAAHFGVPQRRNRFFAIASLHGHEVHVPQLCTPPVTVDEAFADLPPLEIGANSDRLPYRSTEPSAYARALRGDLQECVGHLVSRNAAGVVKRYAHIPQGGNWENIPAELMDNYKDHSRCHTGIYHRLHAERPSIVIGNYRKNMLIHPTQHRGLSVREAARLQSFPDNFEFKGSIGFQQQQVGNAVPPLLARAVFDAILNCNQ